MFIRIHYKVELGYHHTSSRRMPNAPDNFLVRVNDTGVEMEGHTDLLELPDHHLKSLRSWANFISQDAADIDKWIEGAAVKIQLMDLAAMGEAERFNTDFVARKLMCIKDDLTAKLNTHSKRLEKQEGLSGSFDCRSPFRVEFAWEIL